MCTLHKFPRDLLMICLYGGEVGIDPPMLLHHLLPLLAAPGPFEVALESVADVGSSLARGDFSGDLVAFEVALHFDHSRIEVRLFHDLVHHALQNWL